MKVENDLFDLFDGSGRTDNGMVRTEGDCISRKAVISAFRRMEMEAAGDEKAVKLMKALQEFIEAQPAVSELSCRARRMAEYKKRMEKARNDGLNEESLKRCMD